MVPVRFRLYRLLRRAPIEAISSADPFFRASPRLAQNHQEEHKLVHLASDPVFACAAQIEVTLQLVADLLDVRFAAN